MLAVTLKSLLSRKLRLVLSGTAVVLGVMAVSGALVLTDNLNRSFDALFQTINTDLDVQVSGKQNVKDEGSGEPATDPVPASVVDRAADLPGVQEALGTVMVDGARVIGPNGKVISTAGPPRWGQSWQGERGLVELRSGRGPERPGEVAINAGLAKEGKFQVGDRIDVLTLQPKKTFTVSGIFGFGPGRDSLAGEFRVAFTQPVAQELLLGTRGGYSSVDIAADGGVSQDQLRDEVRAAVGDRYVVRTGEQVTEDMSAAVGEFLGIMRTVLLGFAGVALFVGVFLILNTFSILVAQRTRELALFRAMGASRGQLIRSVLAEAVLIGVIAATLGLVAGLGVAALLKMLFESFSGADFPSVGLTLPAVAVVASYLVGVLVTVIAALLPALRASRIPPVAAMQESATADKPLRRLTLAGAVAALAGAGAMGAALFGDPGGARPAVLFGAVLLIFVGIAMLTPSVSRPVVAGLGRVFAGSMPGKLGQRNSARSPRRTAITAAALMVGIALVTGVSVVASSLKASISDSVQQDLRADLVISGDTASRFLPAYDPRVIDQVRQIAGVTQAVAVYADAAQIGTSVTPVAAGDAPAMASVFSLHATAGELRALRAGEILVDDETARDRGLTVGKPVELITQRGGPRPFTVVGVFERSELQPGPVLSVPDAIRYFRSPQAAAGYITLADGADLDTVSRRVDTLLRDNPEVTVRNQREYSDQQAAQVDTFVVLLYVLLGLAIVIAVLGVVNTLALSILERTRELGLLRAVGMRRLQITQMVTVESVVISVFGALLGTVVGSGLGAAVAGALQDEGISTLSLPWGTMAVFLGLAVVVGLVAAVLPAVRASRVDMLRAIGYE